MGFNFKSLLILAVFFASCQRWQKINNEPVGKGEVRQLWHRAGGGYVDSIPENSMKAILGSIHLSDGIECDVQISADGNIWLSHDHKWKSCTGDEGCIPETKDKAMWDLNQCKERQYILLDSVFNLLNKVYTDKWISLDVKQWFPCGTGSLNIPRQMKKMALKIADLVQHYQLQGRVLVESDSKYFLKTIQNENTGIETYLLVLGKFEEGYKDCLVGDFSGISFKYDAIEKIDKRHVDMMHENGKKIQLWNVGDHNIEAAKSCFPDFIQIDYIP